MISILQDTLAAALSAVVRASQKSALATFALVRLDAHADGSLHLSCFNGESAARVILNATCTEDFSACVDAQTLKAIVDTLSGDVRLSITENSLLLQNGANRTTLRLNEETLPVIGEDTIQPLTTLPGSVLRSLLRVLPFTSTDEARPALSVLQLTLAPASLTAQAADGYAAGRVQETITGPKESQSICLSAGFTRLLAGLVDESDRVQIGTSGKNHFVVQISNSNGGKDLTLATVTAEADFPSEQIAQLMSTAQKDGVAHLSVQKTSLSQTLKMVNAMGTQNTYLKASGGTVKMASEETSTGQARNVLDGSASGVDAHVWLSAVFLKRVAEACKSTIAIRITANKKPVLFEEGNFTGLIMPLLMDDRNDPFPDHAAFALNLHAMAAA